MNNNVGWGGDFNSPTICPSGYSLAPNPRSFTTGIYTEFGAYLLNNVWTNLPSQVLDAAPNGGTASHLEYTDNSGHFQNPGWQSSSPHCGWHTFGAQWNPAGQTVTFYWDGAAVFTHQFIDNGSQPEYLIFDYQMASQAIPPAPGGATMNVDWVRAWN